MKITLVCLVPVNAIMTAFTEINIVYKLHKIVRIVFLEDR